MSNYDQEGCCEHVATLIQKGESEGALSFLLQDSSPELTPDLLNCIWGKLQFKYRGSGVDGSHLGILWTAANSLPRNQEVLVKTCIIEVCDTLQPDLKITLCQKAGVKVEELVLPEGAAA